MTRGKSNGPRNRGAKNVGSGRELTVRVKTSRGRKISSQLWLQRQLNDPYVARAKAEGMRSRAAYKLIELDDRFHVLARGRKVVDLGAAPGGWTQVAVDRCGPNNVVGIDINAWDPLPGAICLTMDFLDPRAPDVLREALGGKKADVVLSDMAAPATGHAATDHLRIIGLAEVAWAFAEEVLAPGGTFVCKVFQGGTEGDLLKLIKKRCGSIKHVKPPASRKDSAEVYLLAQDFKG